MAAGAYLALEEGPESRATFGAATSNAAEPALPRHDAMFSSRPANVTHIASLDDPGRDDGADRMSDLTIMFTMRGSVIPRVAGMCTACAVLGVMGLFAYEEYGFVFNDFLHKLVVMPLGFLLVFRSNLAYGRFWESRGAIGAVLRHSRQVAMLVGLKLSMAALQAEARCPWPPHGEAESGADGGGGSLGGASAACAACVRTDSADARSSASAQGWADGSAPAVGAAGSHTPPSLAQPSTASSGLLAVESLSERQLREHCEMAIEMQRLLVTLYYVIVHLLRNLPPSADDAIMQQLTGDEIEELKTAVFRPIIVVRWSLQHVQAMADSGVLCWWEHQQILSHFDRLLEAVVGAHKVASTPIPFPYTQLLSWLVNVFIGTMPLAVAGAYAGGESAESALSPITIISVCFTSIMIALALLGINETAAELEAPFGFDPNDIPLGRLGEGMEVDIAVLLRGRAFAKALVTSRTKGAAAVFAPRAKT
ncbi:hypothetical protein KFE25_004466 [Diacronema lutheri]|uniref:Bestrophin homolog n=1 Tax=Diacronema lutheri TaxID=2081491 RepID=A0A8J5X638_DIALT|nr:hypothetical protein KFE25_004466 [Diacronema lutheri]